MDKEIIEWNEAISIFMELDRNIYHYPPIGGSAVISRYLKYHSSFDWIMPVVEKIEEGNYGFKMCRKVVEVYFDDTKEVILKTKEKSRIESLYKAVVQFIELHNTQSKQQ